MVAALARKVIPTSRVIDQAAHARQIVANLSQTACRVRGDPKMRSAVVARAITAHPDPKVFHAQTIRRSIGGHSSSTRRPCSQSALRLVDSLNRHQPDWRVVHVRALSIEGVMIWARTTLGTVCAVVAGATTADFIRAGAAMWRGFFIVLRAALRRVLRPTSSPDGQTGASPRPGHRPASPLVAANAATTPPPTPPPRPRRTRAAGCFLRRTGCFLRHIFSGNPLLLSSINAYVMLCVMRGAYTTWHAR